MTRLIVHVYRLHKRLKIPAVMYFICINQFQKNPPSPAHT